MINSFKSKRLPQLSELVRGVEMESPLEESCARLIQWLSGRWSLGVQAPCFYWSVDGRVLAEARHVALAGGRYNSQLGGGYVTTTQVSCLFSCIAADDLFKQYFFLILKSSWYLWFALLFWVEDFSVKDQNSTILGILTFICCCKSFQCFLSSFYRVEDKIGCENIFKFSFVFSECSLK